MKAQGSKFTRFAPFLPPFTEFDERPFRLAWMITARSQEEDSRREALFDLTTDEAARVVDMATEIPDPIQFFVGAANPFLREDFTDILTYARERKRIPVVWLDADQFAIKDLEMMKSLGVTELIAVVRRHDETLARSLLMGSELGFRLHVRFEVNDTNLLQTGLVFEECERYKVATFILHLSESRDRLRVVNGADMEDLFGYLYCTMRESSVYIETDQCPQYRRYIIERYIADRHGQRRTTASEVVVPGVNLDLARQSLVFKSPETMKHDAALKTHGLNAGDGILFIDAAGHIKPERAWPHDAGSVRSQNALEVYRDSTLFKQLRARRGLQGKCRSCPYIVICGGCRERAHSFTEDLFAEEPLCNFHFQSRLNR